MVNSRRSEFDIVNELLIMARDGVMKTELIYKGNLSYHQVQKYLTFLLERDMLKEKYIRDNGNSRRVYVLTEKGSMALADIKRALVHFQ